jgi:hypothetical protein
MSRSEAAGSIPIRGLPAHSRLLRWNDNGFLGALKVAHGHVGRRILELEIFGSLDGERPLVIVGPGSAVDRDLPTKINSWAGGSSLGAGARCAP